MWRFKVLLSFVLVLCAWAQISEAAQHDYVIDNAPGATVRADINSSLQAIVTNNSGATEPSTTYPNMWWYDTSTSLLKRRNNADDAWITVGLEAASTDGTFAANSDSLVPTQKAAKTYADTKVSKSTAAEIYNVTEKATPAANDVLLLEDSAASYAKKSVKISNIRQSIDAVLPSQTGNSGKFLTTNGSAASWGSGTYDSGWFAVTRRNDYVKNHNLGTTKLLITMYFSLSADGSNSYVYQVVNDVGSYLGAMVVNVTTTQLTLRTLYTGFRLPQTDGSDPDYNAGYCRVVAMALP